MKNLIGVLFLASCATIPKTEQVKIRAAHDLQCDQSQVQTTALDDRTMRVDACGKQATYHEECPTGAGTASTRCTWVTRDAVPQAKN